MASHQTAAEAALGKVLPAPAQSAKPDLKPEHAEEVESPFPLVAFNFQGSESHRRAARAHRGISLVGAGVTVALHLLIAAALLLHWQASKKTVVAEPMIFVQLTEVRAEKPIPTPPAPKIEQPKFDMPDMMLPDFTPLPNAITPPQVKSTPPLPASDAKAVETYASKMMQHLNRYKRYPALSRQRKEEGTAQLSFTIDRQGNVLSSRILRSSGHPRLDEETLAMVKRASPIPVPPQDLWRDPMELVVPVDFSLVR